jgi:hypothetical protein
LDSRTSKRSSKNVDDLLNCTKPAPINAQVSTSSIASHSSLFVMDDVE